MNNIKLFTGRGGLGRLAAWHLSGGPVGPASRWASTSNVEVCHTTYAVNRGRVGRKGREGSEGQIHKEEKREGGSGNGKVPLAVDGGLFTRIFVHVPPNSYSYASADRPVCLLSQGQFEEPVRPRLQVTPL